MSVRINKRKDNKKKILVVDDEPGVIMIISKYLKRNDYDVITAENGEEAMIKARNEKPNLILLDTRMPVMDGWKTLEHLRNHPDLNNIPVIMVTALCEAKDVATTSAYGIDDYIAKPFDPAELIKRVVRTLKSKDGKKIACDKS